MHLISRNLNLKDYCQPGPDSKSWAQWTHHDWENDGRHGGLEDPEQGQAHHLDEGEEVDLA